MADRQVKDGGAVSLDVEAGRNRPEGESKTRSSWVPGLSWLIGSSGSDSSPSSLTLAYDRIPQTGDEKTAPGGTPGHPQSTHRHQNQNHSDGHRGELMTEAFVESIATVEVNRARTIADSTSERRDAVRKFFAVPNHTPLTAKALMFERMRCRVRDDPMFTSPNETLDLPGPLHAFKFDQRLSKGFDWMVVVCAYECVACIHNSWPFGRPCIPSARPGIRGGAQLPAIREGSQGSTSHSPSIPNARSYPLPAPHSPPTAVPAPPPSHPIPAAHLPHPHPSPTTTTTTMTSGPVPAAGAPHQNGRVLPDQGFLKHVVIRQTTEFAQHHSHVTRRLNTSNYYLEPFELRRHYGVLYRAVISLLESCPEVTPEEVAQYREMLVHIVNLGFFYDKLFPLYLEPICPHDVRYRLLHWEGDGN